LTAEQKEELRTTYKIADFANLETIRQKIATDNLENYKLLQCYGPFIWQYMSEYNITEAELEDNAYEGKSNDIMYKFFYKASNKEIL